MAKRGRPPRSVSEIKPALPDETLHEYAAQKEREYRQAREAIEKRERQRQEEQTRFLRLLKAVGVRQDDLTAVMKDAGILHSVAEELKRHRFLSEPGEVVKTFLELNEGVWKNPAVTLEAIEALGSPPSVPISDECGLYAPVLLLDMGNPLETLRQNIAAFLYTFGHEAYLSEDLVFTDKGVRLSPKALPRPVGLRWEVVELGRGTWGTYPPYAKAAFATLGLMGIGPELPLIAAEHTHWAKRLGGEQWPRVAAIDLEVCLDGSGDLWNAGIMLFRDTGTGKVGFGTFGTRGYNSGTLYAGYGAFRQSPIDWVAVHKAMPPISS